MSVFEPTVFLKHISHIKPELLRGLGVKAMILDVDNTLATHNNPEPDASVLVWLEQMRSEGFRLAIASNNRRRRVEPFARGLGLEYACFSMKPLPKGFFEISRKLGLPPRSIAVVGDQIFTDVLGGNLFGAKTILVEPMLAEPGPFFRLKRRLEKIILGRKKHERK